ncbi:hypothetical protein AD998_15610 [bacterium 336/3]|nr:hypothetical protein AD998_15610 [bacterium 336/3]
MKNLSKLVLLSFVFVLLSYQKSHAQISVTGKWQSTTKGIFYVVDTDEGFKYQNTQSKIWYFAKWQNSYDSNKYLVYKDSNGGTRESYVTVKKDNGVVTLNFYNSLDGTSSTWTKIGD